MEIQPQGSAIIESKVNILLDMNNRRIDQQFTTMKDTISALAGEIDKLKLDLQNFSETKASKIVQVVHEKQKALNTEDKSPHPKQGSFTPEDVAMEKMFYFGKK